MLTKSQHPFSPASLAFRGVEPDSLPFPDCILSLLSPSGFRAHPVPAGCHPSWLVTVFPQRRPVPPSCLLWRPLAHLPCPPWDSAAGTVSLTPDHCVHLLPTYSGCRFHGSPGTVVANRALPARGSLTSCAQADGTGMW